MKTRTHSEQVARRARAREIQAAHPTRQVAAVAQRIIAEVALNANDAAFTPDQAAAVSGRYRAQVAQLATPDELPLPPSRGAPPRAHAHWLKKLLILWGWDHTCTRQIRRNGQRPRLSEFVRVGGEGEGADQ
jgi:hypothetical protein